MHLQKSAVNGNIQEFKNRLNVISGKEKDPYDSYDFLDSVFTGNEDKVTFFFLLGDYARYDKNIQYKNKFLRQLIKTTAAKYSVGIHPSYSSSKKRGKKKLPVEIGRLEKVTGTLK